jgi:hypothetical protein
MVLIINYALKNRSKDYTPLFNAIKGCGEWWHFLDSTWIVNTAHSAEIVGKFLNGFIDRDTDFLYVGQLKGTHQGWLPKDAWEWLNSKTY